MQFQNLAQSSTGRYGPPKCFTSHSCEIKGVRLLMAGERPEDAEYLYFCPLDIFEAMEKEPEKELSFLLYGRDAGALPISSYPKWNFILFPELDDPLALYNVLVDKIFHEHRLIHCNEVLDLALFERRGLQYLIDKAYSVLRNPIFVSDSANRYLACAYDEKYVEKDSPFEAFIYNDILFNHVDEGGMSVIRSMGLESALATRMEPYRTQHPRFGVDGMFMNIRVHGVPVGRIFTVALERPFALLDQKIFAHLVELVGKALSQDDSFTGNRYEAESLSLVDLLTCSHADEEMTQRCLTAFRFMPQSELYMAAFRPLGSTLGNETLSILRSQLRWIITTHPVAVVGNHLVALFSFAPDCASQEYLLEKLNDFNVHNHLIMGLSNRFSDIRLIRDAYEQALSAAALGSAFGEELMGETENGQPRYLVHFADMALWELLSAYQPRKSLLALVQPEILALAEHDRKNGSEYLNTLRAYLRYPGNSQQVAKVLHIHKNTLLYRINKLTDNFGLRLDNGNEILRYSLSLHILSAHLSGALPAER